MLIRTKMRLNSRLRKIREQTGWSETEERMYLRRLYTKYIGMHPRDFPHRDIVDHWRRSNDDRLEHLRFLHSLERKGTYKVVGKTPDQSMADKSLVGTD